MCRFVRNKHTFAKKQMGCACDKISVGMVAVHRRPRTSVKVRLDSEGAHCMAVTWQVLKQNIANIGVATFTRSVALFDWQTQIFITRSACTYVPAKMGVKYRILGECKIYQARL